MYPNNGQPTAFYVRHLILGNFLVAYRLKWIRKLYLCIFPLIKKTSSKNKLFSYIKNLHIRVGHIYVKMNPDHVTKFATILTFGQREDRKT